MTTNVSLFFSDYEPTPPPPAGASPNLALASAAAATLCRFGVHQLHRATRETRNCYPSPLLAVYITAVGSIKRCGGLACGEADEGDPGFGFCAHSTVTAVPLQELGFKVSIFANRTHASFTADAVL